MCSSWNVCSQMSQVWSCVKRWLLTHPELSTTDGGWVQTCRSEFQTAGAATRKLHTVDMTPLTLPTIATANGSHTNWSSVMMQHSWCWWQLSSCYRSHKSKMTKWNYAANGALHLLKHDDNTTIFRSFLVIKKKQKYLFVDLCLMITPPPSKCILSTALCQCRTQSFTKCQSSIMESPDAYG